MPPSIDLTGGGESQSCLQSLRHPGEASNLCSALHVEDTGIANAYVCACWYRLLQEQFGLESNRGIPEWGRDIFSDMCVIVRPEDPDELSRFIQYCIALHQTHLILSQHARPVTEYSCAPSFVASLFRFCHSLFGEAALNQMDAGYGLDTFGLRVLLA